MHLASPLRRAAYGLVVRTPLHSRSAQAGSAKVVLRRTALARIDGINTIFKETKAA